MPHVRGLVTNAALNIKIGDVENKNIDHAKILPLPNSINFLVRYLMKN